MKATNVRAGCYRLLNVRRGEDGRVAGNRPRRPLQWSVRYCTMAQTGSLQQKLIKKGIYITQWKNRCRRMIVMGRLLPFLLIVVVVMGSSLYRLRGASGQAWVSSSSLSLSSSWTHNNNGGSDDEMVLRCMSVAIGNDVGGNDGGGKDDHWVEMMHHDHPHHDPGSVVTWAAIDAHATLCCAVARQHPLMVKIAADAFLYGALTGGDDLVKPDVEIHWRKAIVALVHLGGRRDAFDDPTNHDNDDAIHALNAATAL